MDDLTRWFSVMEVGFTEMLGRPGGKPIMEEQEPTTGDGHIISSIAGTDVVAHHSQPRRAMTIGVVPQSS